jgi:CheY-like chemotaxis protein
VEHISDNPKTLILLAEDEKILRNALRKILEKAGYSVLIAEDGEQALQIAHEQLDRIVLLISDVQMPGMTGPELARKLRRSRPDLRVMLISAYPQGMLILDTGWHFLQKPFLQSAILDKVKQILNSPSSPDTFSG